LRPYYPIFAFRDEPGHPVPGGEVYFEADMAPAFVKSGLAIPVSSPRPVETTFRQMAEMAVALFEQFWFCGRGYR